MNRSSFALIVLAATLGILNAGGAPPRYDHIVIVVEENRTVGQIIGDRVNAPYINALADGGVRIGSMFAMLHPSQPNYLHLFSGDNQGVVDDNLPPNFSTVNTATYPFRTPNMAAELIAAGFTFVGYSEEIESGGATDWADYDPHSATNPGIYYRRKHNPWANWVAKTSPMPANQLPASVNLCFTNFPSDYSTLPTVSFVIPNQMHDMHDGSRKQGDDWLLANLDRYAKWAKTNNSLLIITWDEDDYNSVNQIPTVLYGAGLRDNTTISGTWTSHNLLRTIEDAYGTTHAGSAAQVRPIIGPFTNDPVATAKTFRQGTNSYTGAMDTQLWMEAPTTTYGSNENLTVDLDTSTAAGNQVGQVLIRFDGIFGSALTQIPTSATIYSAKLIIFTPLNVTGVDYPSGDIFRLHRMLMDWNNDTTWDSMVDGVAANNVEAATNPTFSLAPVVDGAPAIFDVTSDIELFRSGAANYGWLIRPSTTGTGNGWTMKSSETADIMQRPGLEIIYTVPPYVTWARSFALVGADAEPTADPDHDSVQNVAEFAYNMNPRIADAHWVSPSGSTGLPAPRYTAGPGGVLEVEFMRRKGPTAVGLTYAVQFSSNLISWVDGVPVSATSVNVSFERVRVRDGSAGPNAQRFARVVVNLQQ